MYTSSTVTIFSGLIVTQVLLKKCTKLVNSSMSVISSFKQNFLGSLVFLSTLDQPQRNNCCCLLILEGHKAFSKLFDIHHSTDRRNVYKWREVTAVASLPRSGHNKFSPMSDPSLLPKLLITNIKPS